MSRHKDQLSVIAATEEWFAQEHELMAGLQCERIVVSSDELTKVSFLCHPQQVIAVFRKFAEMTAEELPSLAENSHSYLMECKTQAIWALSSA